MRVINVEALIERVVQDLVDDWWQRDYEREVRVLLLVPLEQMTGDDEGLLWILRLAHKVLHQVFNFLQGDLFPGLSALFAQSTN